MKRKHLFLFQPCSLSSKHILKGCFAAILATAFTASGIQAQNISSVSVIVPKKGKETEGYQLLITGFPRDVVAGKMLVNQIVQLKGVKSFNVLKQPESKAAEAVLKMEEGASAEDVLRNALCLIPAGEYRLGKKSFSDCKTFTLNKK